MKLTEKLHRRYKDAEMKRNIALAAYNGAVLDLEKAREKYRKAVIEETWKIMLTLKRKESGHES